MYARDVDEAQTNLRDLRHVEREEFVLAALVFWAALVATKLLPQLAFPLFLGGVAVAILGVRADLRRCNLLDSLAAERDAYVIPEVFTHASRKATIDKRRSYAWSVRAVLTSPGQLDRARVAAVAGDLESLAHDLEDDGLGLDPAAAVACARLFSDTDGRGTLFDEELPPEELRARIRHVRAGFTSVA